MILQFLIGIIVGAIVVGGSVERTLGVHEGNVLKASFYNILASLSYFLSTYWVAKDNYVAFSGTVVGSSFVIIYLSRRNKRKMELGK